jgi:hypothetical protein
VKGLGRGILGWKRQWPFALACLLVLLYLPARKVAVSLSRHALVDRAEALYASRENRARVAEYATRVLGYLSDTDAALDLYFLLARVHEEAGDPHLAVKYLSKLFARDPDALPAANRRAFLEATMARIGRTKSAEYCRFIYEKYLAGLEGISVSPFRFFTRQDWSVIDSEWETQLYGSEARNEKLWWMLRHYPDHPDRPYVLYLLGDAASLIETEEQTSAKLLAMFHVARLPSTTPSRALSHYREIIASDSRQSFVDDAACRAGHALIAAGQPADALRLLVAGYGRGNADRSAEIEALIVDTVRLLPPSEAMSALEGQPSLESRDGPAPSRTVRVFARGVLAFRVYMDGGSSQEVEALLDTAEALLRETEAEMAAETWREDYAASLESLRAMAHRSELPSAGPLVAAGEIEGGVRTLRGLLRGPTGTEVSSGEAFIARLLRVSFDRIRTRYHLDEIVEEILALVGPAAPAAQGRPKTDPVPPSRVAASHDVDLEAVIQSLGALADAARRHGQEAIRDEILEFQFTVLLGLTADETLGGLAQASGVSMIRRELSDGKLRAARRWINAASRFLTDPDSRTQLDHLRARLSYAVAFVYKSDPLLFIQHAQDAVWTYERLLELSGERSFGVDVAAAASAIEEQIRGIRSGALSAERLQPPESIRSILEAYGSRPKSTPLMILGSPPDTGSL